MLNCIPAIIKMITINAKKGWVLDMKPVIEARRCCANEAICTVLKGCPLSAVSYIEVDEPILDKFLNCNCDDRDCGDHDLGSCEGSPYGRIVIDYDKCTRCGLCVAECCGTAIGLFPESYVIEPIKGKQKCDSDGDCR